MISPWLTLGLLFGFVAIWTWLGRNITITRLMNLHARGLDALQSGKFDDARAVFTDLLAEARHHRRGWDLAVAALTFLAAIHDLKDEPAEAAEAWKLAAAERNKSATRHDALIAAGLAQLARRRAALGKLAAAESLAEHALELAGQSPDVGEAPLVACLQARATVFLRMKQPEKAIPLLERAWSIAGAFGPDDPRPVEVQTDLANAFWRQKNFDRAAALFDQAIEGLEQVVTKDGFVPDALLSLHRLRGYLASDLGQIEMAHEHFDRAVGLCELTGREDKSLGSALTNRGNARMRLDRRDEAEADLKRAIDLFKEDLPANDPGYLFTQAVYASLQTRMGRHEKAIRLATHVLAIIEAPLVPTASEPNETPTNAESPEAAPDDGEDDDVPKPAPMAGAIDPPFTMLSALTTLGRANLKLGHFEEAEQFARRAVAMAEPHLPATGVSMGRNLHRLALIAVARSDMDGARNLFQQAIDAYELQEDRSELNDLLTNRDRAMNDTSSR